VTVSAHCTYLGWLEWSLWPREVALWSAYGLISWALTRRVRLLSDCRNPLRPEPGMVKSMSCSSMA
jgi:hypothetical protein